MKKQAAQSDHSQNRGRLRGLLSALALPAWMLSLLGLDLLLRMLYGYVGGVDWTDGTALGFTALWVLLLGAAAWLLPRPAARILIVLSTVASCLLTATHAVMYHLFGNFFGFSDLLYAGDGAAFFSFQYLHMRKLLLLGLLVTLAVGVAAAVFLPKRPYRLWRLLPGFLVLALSAAGLFGLNASLTVEVQVNDKMSWNVALDETQQEGTPEQLLYSEFKNPNACLPMAGLYQYTARDLYKTFFSGASQDKSRKLSQLDAWVDARPAHEDNEMTGVLEGKNLIMIMVESLDTWMLTEQIMPNLWALRQQSVDLIHHYTPLYLNAGTFATEFTSMTGIIPPISGVSTDAYMQNALPAALPKLFAQAGYRVNSFHSANPVIYNRGAIHQNLGFEAYHNYEAMGMDDYMLDSQMLNGFDRMVSTEEPFFSFIITYSGHGPYTDYMDNIASPHMERARQLAEASGISASADTYDQYVRAIAHITETDDFIGGLVEKLDATGLLDDTVLIVYGDHYCKYLTDTDFLSQLKGAENRNLLCNTPLLIWSGELAAQTVEKYTSTVDLFPTVCNLFRLNADLRCFVGDDVFSPEGGWVFWRDSSCYDGETYIDGTQTAALPPEQKTIYDRLHTKLDVSRESFQYDYFAVRDPLLTD